MMLVKKEGKLLGILSFPLFVDHNFKRLQTGIG